MRQTIASDAFAPGCVLQQAPISLREAVKLSFQPSWFGFRLLGQLFAGLAFGNALIGLRIAQGQHRIQDDSPVLIRIVIETPVDVLRQYPFGAASEMIGLLGHRLSGLAVVHFRQHQQANADVNGGDFTVNRRGFDKVVDDLLLDKSGS